MSRYSIIDSPSLPSGYPCTCGGVVWVRSMLYRHVPRALVDRPKQGFGIPLERRLRTDLSGVVDNYLSDDRIRGAGLMDWKIVSRLICNFRRGNDDLAASLWFLLAFEMWREQ